MLVTLQNAKTLVMITKSTVVQPSSYRESHTEIVDLASITRDLL